MNLFWAVLIVGAVASVAIAALLLVRRRAPEGGSFTDGDRAAGVFGVLATGFSVLVGLVVFLAFSSYDQARDRRRGGGANRDAAVRDRPADAAARPLPAGRRARLLREGGRPRRVAAPELGQRGRLAHPWGVALFQRLQRTEPTTPSEQAAYDKWLDRTADREEARRDRTHGAVGVIPGPLWLVPFFTAAVILVYMLFFADRGERAVVQAMLIGSVVAVIAAMLLLIRVLDDPLQDGYGGLEPTAMTRTLRILGQERRIVGDTAPLPCDARGRAG